MKNIINKLPDRFKWTIHNIIGHPLSEIVFQLGMKKVSDKIHDITAPSVEEDNESEDWNKHASYTKEKNLVLWNKWF